ncbi:MAG TPA: M20/M25/M40 family metallo-hydrolase, partial [Pyrinomonadaceae bacterium]|nr:M20/M25/M40 family metallo-hydrolase [Pyrinomonadaceae bacterium]
PTVLGQAVTISKSEIQMASEITAKQISDYLHFVASDAMEGRDTPSRGLDATAEFLKMNLSRWGFKPAGDDGTFFQKIAIAIENVDPDNNSITVGGQTFKLFDDFFRVSGNSTASGSLVFAGHGWVVKSKGIDAYKGIDVRGKFIVLYTPQGFPDRRTVTPRPAGVTREELTGTKGTDWADPLTYAAANGAAGILLIGSPQLQGNWAQIRNFFSRGTSYPEKLREAPTGAAATMPVALVSDKVATAIFEGTGKDKSAGEPFAIDKSTSVSSRTKSETKWSQNVVAVWEGGDPVLKNEMVAIGAHYDHVGTNPNAPGPDKIWNGADDDGSGTVAVLAIAEALAKSKVRPKRSVLFVWHCGEEKGLWGSEYFNKFPTVDIKKVVAQLNIDMIGRSKKAGDTNPKNKDLTGEHAIYVIGSEMMSSTLGAITKGTNDAFLKLTYDYKYDDPKDENRFFFRSDHFNYAQKGIPIVFWFDGVHEDYHQPGDHADKIDYAKMEKVTRTIFLTMLELSALKTRPVVDKKLPAELTQ